MTVALTLSRVARQRYSTVSAALAGEDFFMRGVRPTFRSFEGRLGTERREKRCLVERTHGGDGRHTAPHGATRRNIFRTRRRRTKPLRSWRMGGLLIVSLSGIWL